ncbi:MAG: DnaJ domain-containing protein [Roseburia sp.]|nr:DnaJ domain-containing protein [Roseburia sp.]
MKNYYRILNVDANASESEIRSSYLMLANQRSPYTNSDGVDFMDKLADINEAYNVLADPKLREAYDKWMDGSDLGGKASDSVPRGKKQAEVNSAPPVNMTPAQIQVQMTTVRNQAYQAGHARGFTEARTADSEEINKLHADIDALMEDIKQLKASVNDSDRARRDAEQTLLSRNRELAQEKLRANDIEQQLRALRAAVDEKNIAKRTAVEVSSLRDALAKSQQRVRALETVTIQNKMQAQIEQDKRTRLREQTDELNSRIRDLNAELREVRSENVRLRRQLTGEAAAPSEEVKVYDIIEMIHAAQRFAKPTFYGMLGVLVWATADEIDAAFAKLVKEYSSRFDDESIDKLSKINDAYVALSDADARAEYNASIGVTQQHIDEDRKKLEANRAALDEYRSKIANDKFWADFDDTVASGLSGNAEAQNTLGEMYCNGDRVEKDADQAFFWFKEAAKLSHPEALYNLGICYINGEGVEQNRNIGQSFIRRAAKLGSQMAAQFFQN